MSKVIKCDRVSYDTKPKMLAFGSSGGIEIHNKADYAGKILSRDAIDSANQSLKAAIAKSEEIKRRGGVDAKIAYIDAVKRGRLKGLEDGRLKGSEEGGRHASETVRTASRQFIQKVHDLDGEYLKRLSEERTDCIDFAFGLAENVLGIKIDRDSEEFKNLTRNFWPAKLRRATVKIGGFSYPLETLQADGLLSCSDGLQGILVNAEPPAPAAATEEKPSSIEADEPEAVAQRKDPGKDSKPEILKTYTQACDSASGTVPEEEESKAPAENLPPIKNEAGSEDEDEDQDETSDENRIDSEKFVFVRPVSKAAAMPAAGRAGGAANFEDFPKLGVEKAKKVLRKADIKDIAAALSGADDELKSAVLEALPRRARENVLEVIKYLGPVPQEEVEDARGRILSLADSVLGACERDGAGV